MIADMETELKDKQINPGMCFRKGYDDSNPSTAENPEEALSDKDRKSKIKSGRNSLNTDANDSVLSEEKKPREKKKKYGNKKEVEELELSGGPYIEAGKMRLLDYLNTSGYATLMQSSDGLGSVYKDGPFSKIKGVDQLSTLGGTNQNSNVDWGVPKANFSRLGGPTGRSMGFGMPGGIKGLGLDSSDDITTVRLNIPSTMRQHSNAFPGKGKVIPNIDASPKAKKTFEDGIISPRMTMQHFKTINIDDS